MKHDFESNNIKIIERLDVSETKKSKNSKNSLGSVEKDIEIPKFQDYLTFYKKNYKVAHLKEICKYYNLRCSGNKPVLTVKIYKYLFESNYTVIIQKYNSKYLINKYNRLMGPAYIKRSLCMNHNDFFTLDNMIESPYTQFFSYKGENNAIWGFDILSFYNLFIKNISNVLNPYTREKILPKYYEDINLIVKLSKLLHVSVNTTLNENIENMSIKKQIELKCLELFQYMDGLGNYTDIKWFLSLDRGQLLKFINDLMDIWMYRAQLNANVKMQICHPSGDPFRHINHSRLTNIEFNSLQKLVLTVIEQFIKKGIDREMQNLGASYILCGLTLVNSDAAFALPWLFQSVS